MAYPVKADGTIGEGKVFADPRRCVAKRSPGLPDGMKVDTQGNIWATGPGGVYIFTPPVSMLGIDRHGRPDREPRLGRRRQHALHHGEPGGVAGEDEDEGEDARLTVLQPVARARL